MNLLKCVHGARLLDLVANGNLALRARSFAGYPLHA